MPEMQRMQLKFHHLPAHDVNGSLLQIKV